MSSIDNRIVSMEFDNEAFERNLDVTLKSLDRLEQSLAFENASRGMDNLDAAAGRFSLEGIGASVDNISSKFSVLGAVAFATIERMTFTAIDAATNMARMVFDPLASGGRQRALNIENAKFQFRGLGLDVEAAMESARLAVTGTAFGLDEAAKAAAQFGASGIEVGEDMTRALRGIAGAAAMTNTSFTEIADIYTSMAGTGLVNNQDLQRFATRGLNAAAALGKELGITEQAVKEMAAAGELSFEEFATAMDGAFGEHATRANETYTGSLANMKAALARIGATFFTPFLETQRDVFNSLSPAIDKVHTAIKPLISAFVDIARIKANKLIEFINGIDFTNLTKAIPNFGNGIRNLFNSFTSVTTLLKEAFREIFPASATSRLIAISEAFVRFTERLAVGGETADNIRSIFKGFFSILSIGYEIIKGVGGLFRSLFATLSERLGLGGGGILDFLGNIGKSLASVKASLVDGGGIAQFFERLEYVIRNPVRHLQYLKGELLDFADRIREGFMPFITNLLNRGNIPGSEQILNTIGRFQDRMEGMRNFVEGVKDIWRGFSEVFDALIPQFDEVWNYISEWFRDLGSRLVETFSASDFDPAVDLINVGLLGGILAGIRHFMNEGFSIDFGGGIIGQFREALGQLTETLQAMQARLQAEALVKIAIAIGVLALSIVLLSLIDSASLTRALVAIAAGFGILVGVMKAMDELDFEAANARFIVLASTMAILALAMILLAIAVTMLSKLGWEELAKGLIGVAVGMTALVLATRNIAKDTAGLIAAGIAMSAIAIALILLSTAVKSFSEMSWEEMAQGLIGVGVGLGFLTIAVNNMPDDMMGKGAGMVLLAVGLRILAEAVAAFAELSWGEMVKGLAGVGASLLIIAAGMNLMPSNLLTLSTGMVLLSASLYIMAQVIQDMGSTDFGTLAKGLGALAIMLGILVVAMNAMKTAGPGAAALVVTSAALYILSGVLKELGQLSLAEIGKGLLAIAGVFAVLGLAAYLLGPITPAILALGWALLLVGGAFALFGIGVKLVADGFERLAQAGETAVDVLIAIIEALIEALPGFVAAFVTSLIEMASEVLEAAPVLLDAIRVLLIKLIETFIELIPKLAEALGTLILAWLDLIRDLFPEILDTGLVILMALLQGIRDNIGELLVVGIEIVTNLVNGMIESMPHIVNMAVNLITSFLDTMALQAGRLVTSGVNFIVSILEGIAANISRIVTAGTDVLIAFLNGIRDNQIRVIEAVGEIVTTFVTTIGAEASQFVTAGTNALVEFLNGVAAAIPQILTAGANVIISFIKGLGSNAARIVDAAFETFVVFLNALADTINEHADELREAGRNIAMAIIGGLTFGLIGGEDAVGKAVTDMANTAKQRGMSALEANSPSKVFMRIGGYIAQGLALGIDKDTSPKTSARNLAKRVIASFEDTLGKVPFGMAGMADLNPVITPVLDLTRVQAESRNLEALFATSAINPGVSFDQARTIATTADLTNTDNNVPAYAGPTDVTFEQNIYAPSALSTNDIYRNTRSQIALAKEELSIV